MTQGGKRKGAGRKPVLTKKIQYATRLRPDQIKFLKSLKNAAKWLEKLIDTGRIKIDTAKIITNDRK